MKFKADFFKHYLNDVPLPLALERSLECQILSKKKFEHPILDIGCGEGIFAHNLFAEKVDVGIDSNKKELDRAKYYDAYKELIHCHGNKIPKKSGIFNTILSNSVMEHILNIDDVLREANRLLSDEGVMYLTLPTNFFEQYTILYQLLSKIGLKNLARMYSKFFNRFWKHYHCYNVEKWQLIFENNGFEVHECIYYASKSTCMLNDFMSFFSIFSFFTKKILNRWFIFEKIRNFFSLFLYKIFYRQAQLLYVEPKKSGLIFFEIRKQ